MKLIESSLGPPPHLFQQGHQLLFSVPNLFFYFVDCVAEGVGVEQQILLVFESAENLQQLFAELVLCKLHHFFPLHADRVDNSIFEGRFGVQYIDFALVEHGDVDLLHFLQELHASLLDASS